MVFESPKMRVPKQATEQIGRSRELWSPRPCPRPQCLVMAAVIVARLNGDDGMGRRRGPILGAVPLAHEVTDAQHGRVEDQVAPAALGRPLGAGGVRPQRLTELSIKAIQGRVKMGSERDEVTGALLDAALWSLDLALT